MGLPRAGVPGRRGRFASGGAGLCLPGPTVVPGCGGRFSRWLDCKHLCIDLRASRITLFRCAGSREGEPRAETKHCGAFAKAKCQGRHAVGFLATMSIGLSFGGFPSPFALLPASCLPLCLGVARYAETKVTANLHGGRTKSLWTLMTDLGLSVRCAVYPGVASGFQPCYKTCGGARKCGSGLPSYVRMAYFCLSRAVSVRQGTGGDGGERTQPGGIHRHEDI